MVGLGVLAIVEALAVAALIAVSLRFESVVSTLLAFYVALVVNVGFVTAALSPTRDVTRAGLSGAEGVLLAGALMVCWMRGRPRVSLGPARQAFAAVRRDPVAGPFLLLAAAILAYELVLVLTVPANNWDAITYHLARAAAWTQHSGIYWIPNAPTDRLNDFQPLAEQQLLFLFVATGTGALYALPQYLAELALLVAIYGGARRIGYAPAAASGCACLFACFSLVSLESTTAQNDLVAAALAATAACLLLGGGTGELALAGVAAGAAFGVKLTAALVLPILVWLAALRGRTALAIATAGGVAGFVLAGMWGYILNAIHTGDPLGGTAAQSARNSAAPSWPGSLQHGLHILYRLFDLSAVSIRTVVALAVVGVIAATLVFLVRRSTLDAVIVAVVFLSPLLVLAAAGDLAYLTKLARIPVHVPGGEGLNRSANEDVSAFGPLGVIIALAVPLVTLASREARRDRRQVALALALPVAIVILALVSKYNPFLTRFLLASAAVSAPLFALVFQRRHAGAAVLVMAGVTAGLTLTSDTMKPLSSRYGWPWQLTQANAIRLNWQPRAGTAYAALARHVPPNACLGALIGGDQPGYLLWGPHLTRRVTYLPQDRTLNSARRDGLTYVVLSPGSLATAKFTAAGWRQASLAGYWDLVTSPDPRTGGCD